MRSFSEMSRAAADASLDKSNVVRLGTETLFAIAEELRRMYDADLRSKPSKRLERLLRTIEHGGAEPAAPPDQT